MVYINRAEMKEFEYQSDKGEITYRYTPESGVVRKRHIILAAESELFRIVRYLSSDKHMRKERKYIPEILSLKVDNAYSTYKNAMLDTDGTLIYDGITYKRIIVSSSHSRTRKVMMVAIELWDKVMDILVCGLDRDLKYSYMSKWSSYIGLCATDSIPVSMPNIVVIPDLEILIKDTVDVVEEQYNEENGRQSFRVINNQECDIETNLFDGAGLVTVEKSKAWSEELRLNYIPSSYQFRCIPCLKGKLYTFDVRNFARQNNVSEITDLWGRTWDLFEDEIDCIMTKSQFKFSNLYDSYESWLHNFRKHTHGYRRSFNVSEYDESYEELSDYTVLTYQALQTLDLSQSDIESLCTLTCERYRDACCTVEGFLKFRGIAYDVGKNNDDETAMGLLESDELAEFPSYYQALTRNHDLFYDDFIRKKVNDDLLSFRKRAYTGKVLVKGNYQTLLPDLYGLVQHAFKMNVTGLLFGHNIYSNYWNNHKTYEGYIDIIRSPHIAREHCPVKVVTNEQMEYWYQYQQTGIILSVFDNTIALKLNSADFDGDHVLTTNNEVLLYNLLYEPRNMSSNTIHHIRVGEAAELSKIQVDNLEIAVTCDYKGFRNNIGSVINPISALWALPQTGEIADYIKIMSIVGSIRIDYAKHGEEAPIPRDIKILVDGQKKQYFTKYLRANRQKAITEKVNKKVAQLVDSEIKPIFFDNDCTMNRLCHYLEEKLQAFSLSMTEKERLLFSNWIRKTPNLKSKKYGEIRKKLVDLQNEFAELNYEKFRIVDTSNININYERRNQFDDFFAGARYDLLSIENDAAELLDYLITIYYTDKKFMRHHIDKSILWRSFPMEMINRTTDYTTVYPIDMSDLEKRSKKAKEIVKKQKQYRKEHIVVLDFEENTDVDVQLYKEDVSWIKKMVSSKLENSNECRRVLLVVMYITRKCRRNSFVLTQHKRNKINYSVISRLTNVHCRKLIEVFKTLKQLQIIEISQGKGNGIVIELLSNCDRGDSLAEDKVHYEYLPILCNKYFRKFGKSS